MAEFRFYAELGDFLPLRHRGRSFEHAVAGHQSVKHAIEALGVPHTEVGLLLINGQAASLDSRIQAGDRVSVLPVLLRLMPPRQGNDRFIADAHLGRLARYLRFAGVDTRWRNAWSDADLVKIACSEERVVLTRDRDLLMHRALGAGCYLRDKRPLAQLAEVARRYALDLVGEKTSRCLECNEVLESVSKPEVAGRLQPGTVSAFDEFWRCRECGRVFWRGSHWKRMRQALADVARELG